jgi:hypothetical protein
MSPDKPSWDPVDVLEGREAEGLAVGFMRGTLRVGRLAWEVACGSTTCGMGRTFGLCRCW